MLKIKETFKLRKSKKFKNLVSVGLGVTIFFAMDIINDHQAKAGDDQMNAPMMTTEETQSISENNEQEVLSQEQNQSPDILLTRISSQDASPETSKVLSQSQSNDTTSLPKEQLKTLSIEQPMSDIKKDESPSNEMTKEEQTKVQEINHSTSFNGTTIETVTDNVHELQPASTPESKTMQHARVIVHFDEKNRQEVLENIKKIPQTMIKYEYKDLIVGASVDLPINRIDELKNITNLEHIEVAKAIRPYSFQAKLLTQAMQQSKKYQHDGRGMVIALLDSGMDIKHKDMRLDEGIIPKIKNITETPNNEFTLKVPHGYNYIENNTELIDNTKHPHGMHLAGILAGNATEEDIKNKTGISGIAPNAQLLAYKVFSDDKTNYVSTSDDVVYAAMEDAINHGADVISLSIGEYGTGKPGDSFYRAVEKAYEKGVIVVAAMGNAATSSSDTSYDDAANNALGMIDTATTVSVAANPYVIGVGSSRNLALPVNKMTLNDLEVGFKNIGTEKLPPDTYTFEYIREQDVDHLQDMNIENKIVVIDDYYKSVPTLVTRLKLYGVKGIILGNINTTWNSDYYEKYYVLSSNDELYKGIFAGTISGNDLEKVKSLINQTPNLTVKIDDKMKYNQIFDKTSISGFSSWGPSIDLELKPDIVAPGEDVYSTFNHNTYGLMSGTSMAAPHIAGASTILLPIVKEKFKDAPINAPELTRLIMMNTAIPIEDATSTKDMKIENSPRQQGAGMLQIANAQNTDIIAYSSNKKGAVSLKEIGSETVFTITLENLSSNTHTFKVEPGQVLTSKDYEVKKQGKDEVRIAKEIHSAIIEGASITKDKDEVTLQGHEKIDVTFTLKTGIANQQFAEGFIYFKSKGEHPDLSVPYFGFVGDWGKESIIDAPMWEANSKLKQTALITRYEGKEIPLGTVDFDNPEEKVDPEMVAMTNTNILQSSISDTNLRLLLLRDGTELMINILDSDKNPIRTLYKGAPEARFRYTSYFESKENGWSNYKYDIKWDGKAYNKQSGKIEPVAEGQYYYQIKVRNSDRKAYQETLLPIKVDNTLPIMTVNTSDVATTGKIKIQTEDNNKIWHLSATLNGEKVKIIKNKENNYEIDDIKLNKFADNNLVVKVMDIAGNTVSHQTILKTADILFENLDELNRHEVEAVRGVIKTDNLSQIEAVLNGKKVEVVLEGKEFTINTTEAIPGKNILSVVFKDDANHIIAQTTHQFIQDLMAPNLDEHVTYDDDFLLKVENGRFNISGTVTDDVSTSNNIKLYYYNSEKYGNKDERQEIKLKDDGTFNLNFVRDDFKYGIILEAVDEAGRKTTRSFSLDDNLEDIPEPPFIFDLLTFNTFITTNDLKDIEVLENGNYMYSFMATTDDEDYAISINGGEKQKPNEDGKIEYKVEIHPGFNPLKVNGYDADGNLIMQRLFHVYIDIIKPKLELQNLANIQETDDPDITGILYTNQPEVELLGRASDHGLYWNLIINEDALERGGEWLEFKETAKDFKHTVTVKDNDLIKIHAEDFFGNSTEKYIFKVKLDTEKPTMTTNIIQNKVYEMNELTPQIAFTDNIKIKSEKVLLNGQKFTPNMPITEAGDYTLTYEAIDLADNKITGTINFSVRNKLTPPKVQPEKPNVVPEAPKEVTPKSQQDNLNINKTELPKPNVVPKDVTPKSNMPIKNKSVKITNHKVDKTVDITSKKDLIQVSKNMPMMVQSSDHFETIDEQVSPQIKNKLPNTGNHQKDLSYLGLLGLFSAIVLGIKKIKNMR